MKAEDTAMDFLSGYDFFTLGTFYWASLDGERNMDPRVPCPSSPWGNLWSPGVNKERKRSSYMTENFSLPDNRILPNIQRKQGEKVIRMREERDERTVC